MDLLGGDDDFGEPQHAAPTSQQDLDFESSYPAIDTQNEVGRHEIERFCLQAYMYETGCSSRWEDHWLYWTARIVGLHWIQCSE